MATARLIGTGLQRITWGHSHSEPHEGHGHSDDHRDTAMVGCVQGTWLDQGPWRHCHGEVHAKDMARAMPTDMQPW